MESLLFSLPEEVIAAIFNKLDLLEEIRTHCCISKKWNELYCLLHTISLEEPQGHHFKQNRKLLTDSLWRSILTRVKPERVTRFKLHLDHPFDLTAEAWLELSKFTNINSFTYHGWTQIQLSQLYGVLSHLTNLGKLDISFCNTRGDHLALITDTCTKLTKIELNDFSFKRWPNIAKLQNLKELNLANLQTFVGVSEVGFEDLTKATTLTKLNINYNALSDRKLQSLFQLTNLVVLHMKDNENGNMTAKSYEGLKSMTKLRKLAGTFTNDDEVMGYIGQLSSLTALDLSFMKTSRSTVSVRHFTNLTQLGALRVHQLNLDDAELLSKLGNLSGLSCSSFVIHDNFPFDGLTRVTKLECDSIGRSALKNIAQLQALQILEIGAKKYSSTLLQSEDVELLCKCIGIRTLFVHAASTCIDGFLQLTNLQKLTIRCREASWTRENLSKLNQLPSLRHLILNFSYSGLNLNEVLKLFPSIKVTCTV